MKKVLILSYFYPPYQTGGGLRAKGLGDFLPEHGWEVTIITRRLPGPPEGKARVIQTDYSEDLNDFWNRLLSGKKNARMETPKSVEGSSSTIKRAMGSLVAYPDAQRNWLQPALKAARELMTEEKFDMVLSTSPPQTAHMVAFRLKKEFGTPWVADLRDLWTQNHYYLYGDIRKRIERRLELRTLKGAEALITVSAQLAIELGNLHNRDDVHAISNGFNPKELSPETRGLDKKFTMTHTGTMYEGVRGPQMLFEAMRELNDEGRISPEDFQVRLFGPISEAVQASAEEKELLGLYPSKAGCLGRNRSKPSEVLRSWSCSSLTV